MLEPAFVLSPIDTLSPDEKPTQQLYLHCGYQIFEKGDTVVLICVWTESDGNLLETAIFECPKSYGHKKFEYLFSKAHEQSMVYITSLKDVLWDYIICKMEGLPEEYEIEGNFSDQQF
jgi:hypothetical protein